MTSYTHFSIIIGTLAIQYMHSVKRYTFNYYFIRKCRFK